MNCGELIKLAVLFSLFIRMEMRSCNLRPDLELLVNWFWKLFLLMKCRFWNLVSNATNHSQFLYWVRYGKISKMRQNWKTGNFSFLLGRMVKSDLGSYISKILMLITSKLLSKCFWTLGFKMEWLGTDFMVLSFWKERKGWDGRFALEIFRILIILLTAFP